MMGSLLSEDGEHPSRNGHELVETELHALGYFPLA
jgi:hypothetical protein